MRLGYCVWNKYLPSSLQNYNKNETKCEWLKLNNSVCDIENYFNVKGKINFKICLN